MRIAHLMVFLDDPKVCTVAYVVNGSAGELKIPREQSQIFGSDGPLVSYLLITPDE